MVGLNKYRGRFANRRTRLGLAWLTLVFLGVACGCKSSHHTSDPHLRKIDEMLSKQLPEGTPRARVTYFLSLRGYRLQDPPDKNSLVALVRQVDTATLQPATARVTFHFSPNNNLTSFEMQAVPDAPLPQ